MSETVSALHCDNISLDEFLKQPTPWTNGVLGALCFSADTVECQTPSDMKVPCLRVTMQNLDPGESICEVWRGSGPLAQGQNGAIQYRHDDGALFGTIALPEAMFATRADETPLQQAAEAAYRQAFALLDTLCYPHLFRCWNYIADINAHSFGLERYQQFNVGRQNAFLAYGRDVVGNVPAACALGSAQGPLSIAFLAGRVAPLCIDNTRQLSAYKYPRQYGPRSPTFSRAGLVRLGREEVLFISGTASIVGHSTLHPDNVVAQTRETMTNVNAVLAEANRLSSQPGFDLSSLHYRVYVRHPADLAQIRAEMTRCVGDKLKAVYLQAEVCRADLLLEIEATAAHRMADLSGPENR